MIFRFLISLSAILLTLPALAQNRSLSLSYFSANYDLSYKDQGEYLASQWRFDSLADHNFQFGFSYTERTYGDNSRFKKNNFLLGDVWAPKGVPGYLEISAESAGSTVIGAESAYGITPHTTYFTHWDLGLGFRQAQYQTGDIFIVNPQILYISEGPWIVGHSSWIFNDQGTHHAWREFLRWTEEGHYKAEASISGGENREDVGVIDQFTAYGVNFTKYWRQWSLGVLAERYEGHLRKGNSIQTELQWRW